MKISYFRTLLLLFVFSVASRSAPLLSAQRTAASSDATMKAVVAAQSFLSMLDERQRKIVNPELNKDTRTKWSNLPNGIAPYPRNGIKLGDMTAVQQEAALKVVAAPLSQTGFQKVMNIVNGDEVFSHSTPPNRGNGGNMPRFGRAEFYFAILGTPSATQHWMIQFGGHHLGINITLAAGQNVLTPSHTGAQPASYTLNGETIRPLGKENDKAFALMNALNAIQRKQATLDYEVADTVLGPGHDGEVLQPEGVRVSTFTAPQQTMLLDLIQEWVGIINDVDAKSKMADVKSHLAETYFAWSGPTTNGSAVYFRIQGPTVEVEYAPQCTAFPCGATRPVPDHIHTFYRDPTNDYGAKIVTR